MKNEPANEHISKWAYKQMGEWDNRLIDSSRFTFYVLRSAHHVSHFTFHALMPLMLALTIGCYRDDMRNQPKYNTLDASAFFADGRAARPIVEGTVARGQLRIDDHLYAGKVNGELADTFPMAITAEFLARGQERYNIYCSPCHDRVGNGNGMIVQRGFKRPSSFHIDRLREVPVGHFFDVITNGFGVMYDYAARVKPRDRWAIVAYIRALQLSQHAPVADLPAEVLEQISESANPSDGE